MDYRRETGFPDGSVVQILSGNHRNVGNATDNWEPEWATDDDYGIWNNNNNINNESSQTQSDSEPQNKRPRNAQAAADLTSSNRSKAIGKMFYKTKLCCKFRVGTCPYITNCNFAHSIEELRKPPPNWQEIVAGHDEDHGASSEPREEFQIPILGVSDDIQRSYKGRHCKKFYTEEGCPYGESCTFLHDEHSKTRESVAISLGPGGGGGGGGGVGTGAGFGVSNSNGNTNGNSNNTGNSVFAVKPSNWKTRICNKWELTGYCPFGSKCHFAHGAAELHQFGGGPLDSENNDSSTPDAIQGSTNSAKAPFDTSVASRPSMPHSDGYHMGVPSQRLSNANMKSGQRPMHKWKGPDKISKIYGDWIDDL